MTKWLGSMKVLSTLICASWLLSLQSVIRDITDILLPILILSRKDATLQSALSVRQSVGWLVDPHFIFLSILFL